jgi:anthranilate phosphoribosyltransferase
MLPLMAEVLARRGVRAKLFRGEDGLDELTTTGISAVYDVKNGSVRETHLDPTAVGLPRAKPADLAGGDAAGSAAIARAILDGERGPRRDVVLLNAGAALEVAGFAADLPEAMATAARSIDDGDAARTLGRWVEISAQAAAGSIGAP